MTRLRLTLSVALLAVALAGCGGDDDAASEDDRALQAASTTSTSVAPPSSVAAAPGAGISQPAQPTSGPGGSGVAHGDVLESSGGEGNDAWYVFEPVDPVPQSAPLVVVMHGYYEFEGYDQLSGLIRHTVQTGSVVIYPRWQTSATSPCPGPYNIGPCVTSAVRAIRGALDFLTSDPDRVQPDLDRTSYYGFSFGGIITANLANRHADLDLPVPRVIFLDDPHDGGLTGTDEPALDDSLTGIPSETLVQCHVGAEGVIAGPGKAEASCNALFPKLGHIPDENKDLVLTEPDDHGSPALSSGHGVCATYGGRADAYDWNFCWKTWDALRSAAEDGSERAVALGDTPERRDNGTWSDGVAITPLKIQDRAPIRP